MLDILQQADRWLFLLLNVSMANPFTDAIMPVVTNDNLLRAIYGLAMALILWKGNAYLRIMVITSAVTLALTDQLAANLIKDLIARPRPCHVLTEINLLVGCGGGYAMPSAHAANTFGQAALFAAQFRVCRVYVVVFAALVSISRTFVGVHYPGDIIVGAIIGIAVGLVTARLHSLWVSRRFPHPGTLGEQQPS